jgi:signal transduction histidine kinase
MCVMSSVPEESSGNLTDIMPAEEAGRLRSENAALRAELDEARRSNQQYLQNVAHQLTAPLGAIKWSIEALKNPEVPIPRKFKLLSSIYSQATILVHLIKNFALMSNLEADLELGQFREQPEPVDIFKLCVNLANDFQPQAAESGLEIIVDEASFDLALEGRKVRMVKNLIAQAISNLLENAVKYSDSTSMPTIPNTPRLTNVISITAERAALEPFPTQLIVSVVSKGLPIRANETSKLFDRGFRGGTAKQKVPAGTGIGLYLAKRVMTLHRGTIGVRSNGNVSKFMLAFPLSSLE